MNCVLCNQKMEKITTSFKSKWGKYELTIDGVTGYRCNECNRISFDSNEVDMIQNITAGFSEVETKPDNLNVEEVADLLRVSNQTVYNMIKDGRLPAYKVGREWRFNRQEIIDALDNANPSFDLKGVQPLI
jgi:excisionase family DNA binding protein/YgiT-type zinc finger domain-containing protein